MARKSKLMKNNIDIPKKKKAKKKNNTGADSTSAQNEKFNFDNEIVIGVNIIPDTKKDKPSKKGKNRTLMKVSCRGRRLHGASMAPWRTQLTWLAQNSSRAADTSKGN